MKNGWKVFFTTSEQLRIVKLLYPGKVFNAPCHIAWQETVQGKWLINPGSCGQPRDGQPGASYAILDSERNLEFHRARYDLSRFIEELRDLEYPKPLIDILLRKK